MKNQVDEIMQCLIDIDLRRNKRGLELFTFTSDIDRNTSGVSPPLSCGDVTTLNWRESAGHNNIDVSDDLPLDADLFKVLICTLAFTLRNLHYGIIR